MDIRNLVFRLIFAVLGIALVGGSGALLWMETHDTTPLEIEHADLAIALVAAGIVAIVLGAFGHRLQRIEYKDFSLELSELPEAIAAGDKRDLEANRQSAMVSYAPTSDSLPGQDAPPFELLQQPLITKPMPCSDPMTPMYLLDRHFRILDWNEAFSLAFDHTMEGRRGQPVLEWVYFLENYKQVIDRGIELFGDPEHLPLIDVESIQYNGKRYGRIEGVKRAYPVPDDDGECSGWLVTIDPTFADSNDRIRFYIDLFAQLKQSLIWSEYSLTYDRVLNHTRIYPELLRTLTGEATADAKPVPDGARVLDLGAGTGNLSRMLAQPEHRRLVVAMDNNPMMLNLMRHKLDHLLKKEGQDNGVVTIKQDISSLFGLDAGYFDVVFANNVLYSLPDEAARACLHEINRVLKVGGEFRMGGPTRRTNLDRVFRQIMRDLRKGGVFDDYKTAYNAVRNINYHYLRPMLTRHSLGEIRAMIEDAGFVIDACNQKVYSGQAVAIFAHKAAQKAQAAQPDHAHLARAA